MTMASNRLFTIRNKKDKFDYGDCKQSRMNYGQWIDQVSNKLKSAFLKLVDPNNTDDYGYFESEVQHLRMEQPPSN